jgi:heparin binding hemagglutinin HbhA
MPTFPKTDDVNKAFKDGVDQARTPLLAALGAGDLAAQAVLDAVNKFRTQVNERTESAKAELPKDFSEFKAKLDPSEVRKQLETYGETAKKIYDQLSEHGEETFKKLQDSSQVKKVREQVGTAQGRVEDTVGDVRGLADDVLGRVTRTFAKDEAEAPKTQTAQAESTKAETAQAETAQTETATEKPAAEKPAPKPAAAKATPAAKAAAPKATPAAKKSTTTKTSGN